MAPLKTLLSWSSGKDSAWTLHTLRADDRYDVVGLVTTVNRAADRVAMHAVRTELLRMQADAVGVPLRVVEIPSPCSNDEYEAAMGKCVADAVVEGVDCFAFGDLFLEDVRAYREQKLASSGITPIFPIWGRDTTELAKEMIAAGLRARITCVDPCVISRNFAGRDFDAALLASLPPGADPCGERGEFHTFAYDGPMFRAPVPIASGEIVERDGFVFADIVIGSMARSAAAT
jgi:uncharacterized protein (TIGR00290 family)